MAVHGLRRAFRASASGPVVVLDGGGYRLDPTVRLWLDVDEFELWLDVDEFELHAADGRRREEVAGTALVW